MSTEEHICAISGLPGTASVPDVDGVDLPVGWAIINIVIRKDNPKWAELNVAEAAVADSQTSQVPPEKLTEEGRRLAQILAEATLAPLRALTPRYLLEEHEVEVSAEELDGLMATLGIEKSDDDS